MHIQTNTIYVHVYYIYICMYVNDAYVNKYVNKRGHEFAAQQGKAYGGFRLRKGK